MDEHVAACEHLRETGPIRDGREKLKSLPAFFNGEGLEISQHEAT